jgi:hypothetical protein
MTTRTHSLILIALVALLAGVAASPTPQSSGDELYFWETRHRISGAIKDFYTKAQDPTEVFGYPITRLMDHPLLPGLKVQYFQRARMELDPNAPPGKQVRLSPLGSWLYDETRKGKDANIDTNNGACRLFPVSGFYVCYAFLQFYDANNGAVYFGEPVSKILSLSDGRLVQYFERARMEWWPEHPAGTRVVLTDVGKLYHDRLGIGGDDPEPGPGSTIDNPPPQLTVHAFVAKPLVPANGTQTIYVVVQDRATKQPVANSLVMAVVTYPDGKSITQRLPETDASGLTRVDLAVGNYEPNQVVVVDITAGPDGAKTKISTYFRIWW